MRAQFCTECMRGKRMEESERKLKRAQELAKELEFTMLRDGHYYMKMNELLGVLSGQGQDKKETKQ